MLVLLLSFVCFYILFFFFFVFFFQAEDGIRDWSVTGVQTCALPISVTLGAAQCHGRVIGRGRDLGAQHPVAGRTETYAVRRSEERRVGKECRSRWSA